MTIDNQQMDKLFRIKLERTRAYWDYYKIIFNVLCQTLIALIITAAIFHHKGSISMTAAIGLMALFFLLILLLLAAMSLIIWNFENKHLHELLAEEEEEAPENPDEEARPLV